MSTSPFSDNKLKDQSEKNLRDAKSSTKRPNILLLGNKGVGKSSLINTIFGHKLAETSHFKPETRGFHLYSSPDVSVNIIDSEGYELYDEAFFKQMRDNYIAENFSDEIKRIHICWYCISISSCRVTSFDIENVKYLLSKKIPTAVVFTQCDKDEPEGSIAKALSEVVYRNFTSEVPCFHTSNDTEINKELEIDKLIVWSDNNVQVSTL